MNELYKGIEYKINFEISQIEKELEVINKLVKTDLNDVEIRAAASSLHSVYNGIEKILVLLFKYQNIHIKSNEKWHAELLHKSTEHHFISNDLEIKLREIMGFRHFYRHSYGFMLDIELLLPLIATIGKTFAQFKANLLKDFVE